jgi:hypothetical protein
VHVGQWSVVIGEFALQRTRHSQLTIHNNGFDLSLSFSLANMLQHILSFQSKAPLENYGAKVFFYFGFRMLNFGFVYRGK